MTRPSFVYVDNAEDIDTLVTRLTRATRVAVDTEANSLYNYFERVCLLQLSVDGRHFIVDPLADIALDPLMAALRTKQLILHGADFDLRLLKSSFGYRPDTGVFDTMIAAQLLGHAAIGLAALVKHYFDVELTKTGQKSNWARRPLSDAQLSYACDDTRYLEPLADLLAAELETRGRGAWHAEMCGRVVEATGQEVERDTQNAWRIKGISDLDRRQLAYVREIWRWRDKEAREADLPSFKILGNKQIAELATWTASHRGKPLSKGPNLPRNCVGKRLKALDRAVRKAEALPKEKWPPYRKESPRRRSGPDRKAQIESLRRECAKAAHELEIEASVLAPKATLSQIARADARTPQAMIECSPIQNWQVEILGDRIRTVLESFDS